MCPCVSLSGMIGALVLTAFSFNSDGAKSVDWAITGLALYLAFFSLGVGPGAWLIPSEIFATSIRAKAMSIATFFNRITATVMASTFLSTVNAIGWGSFFFLLAGICGVFIIFFFFMLPETKGRSLEDMSVYFAELTNDTSLLEAEQKIIQQRTSPAVEMTPTPGGRKKDGQMA